MIFIKNIYNYDFKLLVLIAIYFLRRITSKIWYYYNISELLTLKWYKINFYILAFILIFDVKYLLINLFMSNSLFNIFMLFIVALVQIPKLSIFPKKEKRYETIQQEMLYNVKSKKYVYIRNNIFISRISLL